MKNLKRKAKRIFTFLLALVLITSAPQFRQVKETRASATLVIAGVAVSYEVFMYFVALMASLGIYFYTEAEAISAFTSWAYSKGAKFAEWARNAESRFTPHVYEGGGLGNGGGAPDGDPASMLAASMALSEIKEYADYCVDFYKDYFSPTNSTISTDNYIQNQTGAIDGLYMLDGGLVVGCYVVETARLSSSPTANELASYNRLQQYKNVLASATMGQSAYVGGYTYTCEWSGEAFTIYKTDSGGKKTQVLTHNCRTNATYAFKSGAALTIVPVGFTFVRGLLSNVISFRYIYYIEGADTYGGIAYSSFGVSVVANYGNISQAKSASFAATVDQNANIMQDNETFDASTKAIWDRWANTPAEELEPIPEGAEVTVIFPPEFPENNPLTREDVIPVKPTTDPNTDPNTDPSTDPNTDPNTDPDKTPGVNPGTDPGANPNMKPQADDPPIPDPGKDSGLWPFLRTIIDWLRAIWRAINSHESNINVNPVIHVSPPEVNVTVPDVNVKVEASPEAAPAPDYIGNGKLNFDKLRISSGALLSVFPFCIPFDFINAIKTLAVTPKAPVFEMDFSSIELFYGYKWRLDMSEYESLATIVRWGVWVSFLVFLMANTKRFIGWK